MDLSLEMLINLQSKLDSVHSHFISDIPKWCKSLIFSKLNGDCNCMWPKMAQIGFHFIVESINLIQMIPLDKC